MLRAAFLATERAPRHSRPQLLVSLSIGLALTFTAAPARLSAQAGPTNQAGNDAGAAHNSPEYKELVKRGLQEFELGHWAEARVFFSKAHALAPNARTLRGLALVCYESRRYVEASQFAEQALASNVQPLTDNMRSQLQQVLDQARSFVARVRIVTDAEAAELRLDGALITLSADGTFMADPGEHELVAVAPGHEPHSRQLHLEAGREVRFDIALTRQASAAAAPAPQPAEAAQAYEPMPAPEPARTSSSGSIAPWVVIGASAALAVTGGVLLGLGSAASSKVESAPPGTRYSEIKGAYESAPVLSGAGIALLGVGVAGALAGVAWKVWLEPRTERAPSASLRIAPQGVSVAGTF